MADELYEDVYETKFSFGKNWKDFLNKLSTSKIKFAKSSLSNFTGLKSFKGKTFVDLGCGSGLFSLCAILLGAKKVVSLDVDKNSLECAKYLRAKHKISDSRWIIRKGSALNRKVLNKFGKFDIVYSWGVLHHTGNMYEALDNVITLTKKGSILYIAIYNDFRGFPISSKNWVYIKRFYSNRGKFGRRFIENIFYLYYFLGLLAHGRNPFKYVREYELSSRRGMDFFSDCIDWLGGYPFEFASVEKIKRFYGKRGFVLKKVNETKREGCNEFLLVSGANNIKG